MKRNILNIFIPIIFLSTLLVNCSSSSTITEQKIDDKKTVLTADQKKQKALDFFINGGVFETQGNFEAAAGQYEKALIYDSSAGLYYTLAKNYVYLNKLAPALTYALNAVSMDSTKIEYLDLLADIFNYGNQKVSAIKILERAIEIDSSNIEMNYKLARLYEDDKPLQAVKLYNRILIQLGPDWSVLTRIAELQERLGNNDEAINAIKKLQVLDPANIPLKKLLVQFYLKAKQYDEGILLCDEIIELMPYDLEVREAKAKLLLGKDDWAGASKEFDYLLDQQDVNLDAKINIGANYFNKAITDSTVLPIAKAFFTKLDKDTTDWQIKMYLGAIALSEGNDSVAIENFKFVTKNANWNVAAWVRLGGLYFDNRKYDEAEVVMSEAILTFQEDFYVNLILGLSLAQQSKHADAEKYLKKATIINPKDITALSAYAFTLNQLKENDKAIFYLNSALEIEPDDAQLIGTLAMIYNGMQEFEKSDSLYERSLELKPDDPLLSNNYAYSFATRNIQLERALKMVKISIAADSLNSSYLDTIGWVYFMLGNYSEAKLYLEKAIEVGGESSVMLDHLADTESKLGNKEEAIKLWKKSLELDPTKIEIQNKIDKGAI
ncbi:MAG TPA: tetratricopeptide repeat protein [Ignavibacteriaceae bacterium]|nr:tetratricopeptide repeat protein [Ignavibacteriaceae bacterium]HRP93039.1 tetratricopeptide repeat protein [Ignavibacteriaceae bacterium]HRQ55487.1 tetratricopeptide repeat protein [Ignavibacteriaceae bacterium]